MSTGEQVGPVAPGTLRWAVRVVLLQAAVLAVATGVLVYLDLTGEVAAERIALPVAGYLGMLTAIFVVLGAALARRARWARGPAVVVELLQVPIGYTMTMAGGWQYGVPVLALGLLGAVLLVAPSTRGALGIR